MGLLLAPLFVLLAYTCQAQRPPEAPRADSTVAIPKGAFPVLLVDTAVKNRLAEEWEPNNRYQNERGYCVRFTAQVQYSFWNPPVVIYRITSIERAEEEGASPIGIKKVTCQSNGPNVAFLHTHPASSCASDGESTTCTPGGEWGNQCFPSPTDMRSLELSDKPFGVIQCDRMGLAPFWNRKI